MEHQLRFYTRNMLNLSFYIMCFSCCTIFDIIHKAAVETISVVSMPVATWVGVPSC